MKSLFVILASLFVMGSAAEAANCKGLITGSWAYKKGRWMHINVTRQRGKQVDVVVSTKRWDIPHKGRCRINASGEGRLVLDNGDKIFLFSDGSASGAYGAHNFTGTHPHGTGDVSYSPCDQVIRGTWYYKKGRPMTFDIRKIGKRKRVNATVYVKNGPWNNKGRCDYDDWSEETTITFDDGSYLEIDSTGYTTGTYSGIPYVGQAD
ncbi:MAG: hypothetical protein AAF203_06345 [Pseudomonadota bacterium]